MLRRRFVRKGLNAVRARRGNGDEIADLTHFRRVSLDMQIDKLVSNADAVGPFFMVSSFDLLD